VSQHSRRWRISRFLIAALSVTIVVGVGTHFYKYRKAEAAAPSALAASQSTGAAEQQEQPRTVVTITEPTTAPVVAATVSVSAPATRPTLMAMQSTRASVPLISPATGPSTSSVDISAGSSHPIADAKAKIDGGSLVEGRKILNDALIVGTLSAEDKATAKAMISEVNKTLIFSPRVANGDSFVSSYTVKSGERLSRIAADHGLSWEFLARINNLSDPKKLRMGKALKIIEGPFQAIVNKGAYTIELYLGDAGKAGSMFVTSFPVGLGQDDSTPTGVWMVEPQHKLKHPTYYSPRGEGIIDAGDPKNPLGPCWIGLTGTDGHAVGQLSYGIHGTNDPTSVGHQSSLGCIRLHNEDALVVYDLLVEGKSVVVVRD